MGWMRPAIVGLWLATAFGVATVAGQVLPGPGTGPAPTLPQFAPAGQFAPAEPAPPAGDAAPAATSAPASSASPPATAQQQPAAPDASATVPAPPLPPGGSQGASTVEATPAAPAPETPSAKPRGPPAKELFGAARDPSPLAARAIGTYARGCLAGAKPLAIDGPAWQAMRLSRNRNWAHPELVALIERLAVEGSAHDGWPGLLVGDLSQPRGGPMLTGHASHQIGLDADIWFTPMPDRRLSEKEREELAATSMLGADELSVNADRWTPAHGAIVKRVASYPQVERVLVHPAIKAVLCGTAGSKPEDRTWLHKVRPYWGHHYHFHVRIGCPKGSTTCEPQKPTMGDDGCGKELEDWFALLARAKAPPPPTAKPPAPPKPPKPPKPPMTLDELPAECRIVLESTSVEGANDPSSASLGSDPKVKAAKKSPDARQVQR